MYIAGKVSQIDQTWYKNKIGPLTVRLTNKLFLETEFLYSSLCLVNLSSASLQACISRTTPADLVEGSVGVLCFSIVTISVLSGVLSP